MQMRIFLAHKDEQVIDEIPLVIKSSFQGYYITIVIIFIVASFDRINTDWLTTTKPYHREPLIRRHKRSSERITKSRQISAVHDYVIIHFQNVLAFIIDSIKRSAIILILTHRNTNQTNDTIIIMRSTHTYT
jgi:hypothetical protein